MAKTIIPETDTASGSRKKTNKPQDIPSPAAAPVETKPTKELPEFTKYFCDLVGDMILRGGEDRDIKDLVTAAVAHQFNSRHPLSIMKDPDWVNKHLNESIESYVPEWTAKLAMYWPRRGEAVKADAPEPKTVTERIRADARGRLLGELEEFTQEATPEEVRLLLDIIQYWDSNTQRLPDDEEIVLARAFSDAIFDRQDEYILVPEQHVELVRDYLNLLDGKGCKDKK